MIRLLICFAKLESLRADQFRRRFQEPEYQGLLQELQAMTKASECHCAHVMNVSLADQLPLLRPGLGQPDAVVELRWAEGTQPPPSVDDDRLQDLLASLRALEAAFIDRSRSYAFFVAG